MKVELSEENEASYASLNLRMRITVKRTVRDEMSVEERDRR